MINIVKSKDNLTANLELGKNLKLLVNFCIRNKTLVFENANGEFNIELLLQLRILTLRSSKYFVEKQTLFAYVFFQEYKDIISASITSEFKSYVTFLKNITSEFSNNDYKQGYSDLEQELWAIAILESSINNDLNLVEYITSLEFEDESDELSVFYKGYCLALPSLKVEIEVFYKMSNQLIKLSINNAEKNIPLYLLLEEIQSKALKDYQFGLDIFEYSLKQTDTNPNFLVPIISGLFTNLGIDFYKIHINPLIDDETYSVAIISGLSYTSNISEEFASLFLEIYEKFNKSNSQVLINLPKLLFAILRSNLIQDGSKSIPTCFSHLEELITIDNTDLIHFILRENAYQEKNIEARINLVLKLISLPHFEVNKYLNSINNLLWSSTDIGYLKQVLISLAQNCPFKPISKYLKTTFHKFTENNKAGLDEIIINLLISDKASYRFLGLDVFDDVYHKNARFSFEILSLDHLSQYKLWVSILQSYRQPKYTLPCLFPLLKSKSKIVKEAFVCKLEEYTENYGSEVLEIIKTNIDLAVPEFASVYERIEKHRQEHLDKNILVKNDINELNPYYTQNKLFTEFTYNYNRVFSRSLQKSTSESSVFLNFCTTIKLLKGGGWKTEGREEITKLGKISHDFSLPRNYFIEPEKIDYEHSVNLSKEWNNDMFIEIIKALNNE